MARDMVEVISRIVENMMRPLRQRIMMAIARGILEGSDDSKGIQIVKVSLMKDEVREGLERVQNFGFTSRPPDNSELVAVFVGGNREHGFVIACDDRATRFKNLAKGESAIYTDDGTLIHLKKGGEVLVKAATKVTIDIPNMQLKGDLKVDGKLEVGSTIDATGNVTSSANVVGGGTSLLAVKTAYNGHTHVSAAPGVPTAPAVPPIP